MKQNTKANLMLWGGLILSAVCWYGLRAAWFMPALFLVVAYYGAQRLEEQSRWYRYATYTTIVAILFLLLKAAGIAGGTVGAFLLLWIYLATLAFSALGLAGSRNNPISKGGNYMKVLVIGGGGREHAIVHTLKKSPKVDHIWCAPGNGGIAEEAECVALKATDIDGVVAFAKANQPDLVMVAPDDPLALGMVDALEAAGIRAFGPRKNAAVIEGSKSFAKELMQKYNIPTAGYAVFENSAEAIEYIRKNGAPIVIKADGLALGKGVTVAMTEEEAIEAVKDAIDGGSFGAAGARVVIEEFLTGPEVSVLAFVDGKTLRTMPSAQDHKRAYDHDEGPNTGGMGAFSPSRFYTDEIAATCMETIFKPTVAAMAQEGRPFKGVLYFGLMLTPKGPKVIEYNARFGDPETQAVLSRLDSDLYDIFNAVIDEKLDEIEIKWADNAACCVCMASGGYPKAYEKGKEITGLDQVTESFVFHAGTAVQDGKLVTSGGRVLGVTAAAPTLDEAIRKAYADVEKIHFDQAHYRTDIGVK